MKRVRIAALDRCPCNPASYGSTAAMILHYSFDLLSREVISTSLRLQRNFLTCFNVEFIKAPFKGGLDRTTWAKANTLDVPIRDFPIPKLNSENFGIFYPSESIVILNSSTCRALKITPNDIKIDTIP